MSAHTPGPWLYGRKSASSNFDKSAVYRVTGDHMVLADVRSSEADAALIAKAPIAPKLAEALRRFLALRDLDADPAENLRLRDEDRAFARAALAEWEAQ